MNKTVTAFFESYNDAADAVRRLEAAGIARRDISLVANNEGERYSSQANRTFDSNYRGDDDDTHADDGAGTGATVGTLAGGGAGLLAGLGMLAIPGLGPVVAAGWLVTTLVGAGAGAAIGGLAGSLVGAGVPEHDAHAYAEGVRRGGALVTVRATESEVDRIVDILDDEGTVDLDDRQTAWRSDGWTAGSANTESGSLTAGLAGGMGLDNNAGRTSTARTTGVDRSTNAAGLGMTDRSASMKDRTITDRTTTDRNRTAGEEVIPVAEEELHVGKREVGGGRVRIHSHVVERPVTEQVNLREESVRVERRPTDGTFRAGTVADKDLFRERSIEMDEKREEAVVSKEARVKEELVIKKDVENRTQTISDTVRSTEVEIEDERGNRVAGTGTTGTPKRDRI